MPMEQPISHPSKSWATNQGGDERSGPCCGHFLNQQTRRLPMVQIEIQDKATSKGVGDRRKERQKKTTIPFLQGCVEILLYLRTYMRTPGKTCSVSKIGITIYSSLINYLSQLFGNAELPKSHAFVAVVIRSSRYLCLTRRLNIIQYHFM